MDTFLATIIAYITKAIPYVGITQDVLSAIQQEVSNLQILNGTDPQLQASLVLLEEANDAAFTETEAKLEAADTIQNQGTLQSPLPGVSGPSPGQ